MTVLLLHSKVANTIGGTLAFKAGMVVVIAALLGAIAWNLITWFYGLPSSSSPGSRCSSFRLSRS